MAARPFGAELFGRQWQRGASVKYTVSPKLRSVLVAGSSAPAFLTAGVLTRRGSSVRIWLVDAEDREVSGLDAAARLRIRPERRALSRFRGGKLARHRLPSRGRPPSA